MDYTKKKYRVYYRNPINKRIEFFYTRCVHCGKRIRIRERNIGSNMFGQMFYYCKGCSGKEIKSILEIHLEKIDCKKFAKYLQWESFQLKEQSEKVEFEDWKLILRGKHNAYAEIIDEINHGAFKR
jgi:hypothetical protein